MNQNNQVFATVAADPSSGQPVEPTHTFAVEDFSVPPKSSLTTLGVGRVGNSRTCWGPKGLPSCGTNFNQPAIAGCSSSRPDRMWHGGRIGWPIRRLKPSHRTTYARRLNDGAVPVVGDEAAANASEKEYRL